MRDTFRKTYDIWGNFVPGMIFFQSIFGYLVICIIYKWSKDWVADDTQPPGLLNMLIYMFLQPGTLDMQLYSGQATVQVVLLLLAVIQVPVLLFFKPSCCCETTIKPAARQGYRGIGETSRVSALDGDDDDDGHANGRLSMASDDEGVAMITQDINDEGHEEFEFSEVMIHQVIHTIGKPNPPSVFIWYIPMWEILQIGLTRGYRVLSELRFTHCIVPSSLGALLGTSATLLRPLVHDDGTSAQDLRNWWRDLPRCCLLCLLLAQLYYPHHYGGCIRHGRFPLIFFCHICLPTSVPYPGRIAHILTTLH